MGNHFVIKLNCAKYFASVTASDADTVSFKAGTYARTPFHMHKNLLLNFSVHGKSWPNSKCECSHLTRYLVNSPRNISHQVSKLEPTYALAVHMGPSKTELLT